MATQETIDAFLDVARRAVLQAGQLVRDMQPWLEQPPVDKPGEGPTTEADRAAQEVMVCAIRSAYPHHTVRAEEKRPGEPERDPPGRYVWAIDPLDGTQAFLNQETSVTVTLALVDDGKPILGIVYNPLTEEFYEAADGRISTLNRSKLPRKRLFLTPGVIGVLNYHPLKGWRADVDCLLDAWQQGQIGKLVTLGGSWAYNLALVARGAHDTFVVRLRRPADPWDFTAGALLVRNAGGMVTDLAGNDAGPVHFDGCLVASLYPQQHELALALLCEGGFGAAATEHASR